MEKNYESTIEWNAQGKTSFVKAKEAFAIDRLQMDFVEHSGKPECKMKNSIGIYIPMIKSGSDAAKEYGGTGETGQSALGLAKLIVSNELAKRAVLARKQAASEGKEYPSDIWGCIGGTTASRSKDGKAIYRRVSIAPGKAEGSYILRAESCEGEDSSSGGVMPKKGAQRTRITVRVDGLYLDALGEFILTEWSAYRSSRQLKGTVREEVQEEPAEKIVKETVRDPKYVYMIYDRSYYGLMGSAVSPEEAVEVLKSAFRKLVQERGLVADKDEANILKEEVMAPPHNGWLQTVTLREKETDSEEDTLFVMVDIRE